MKNVVKIYFFEAKWYHQNYVSSMKEYMTVALVTKESCDGCIVNHMHFFVGMRNVVTEESFEWLLAILDLLRLLLYFGDSWMT